MRLSLSALLMIALGTHAAFGQAAPGADFKGLEAEMGAGQCRAGPRTVPGRVIPVPETISPELRNAVAAPYRVPAWNANPPDAAGWKALIDRWRRPAPRPCRRSATSSASPARPR